MIKGIKRMFRRPRESVKSQIEKHTKKDPNVEHAFIKVSREKLRNISSDQKRDNVKYDLKKMKEYILKKRKNKQLIHTHVNQVNIPHIPSITDLFKLPIIDIKGINAVSITNSKGNEMGRIIYNYSEKKNSFKKKIKEVKKYVDIASEQMLSKKIRKEDFLRNYDVIIRELTEIQMIEFSKKIKKEKSNWNGQDYLDFFKEIGFNIKIRPSKGYRYNVEELRFIKA